MADMRTVSAAFLAAIGGSHQLAVEAVFTATDGTVRTIGVSDGSVTLDQTAAVRGALDLTVVDDGTLGLVPTGAGSLLAPYGTEVQVSRGIMFPGGATELVGLGVFRVQVVEVTDTADGMQIRVSGMDRAQRIIDARFEAPYQVVAGSNYATALEDVLRGGWPGIELDFPSTALTTPSLVAQEGDDRWAFAQNMATAMSMRLFFDGDGVCVLRPETQGNSVAALREGVDGVLLSAGRQWTREGAYNRVIATGENTGETAPARGVASDLNPESPTYYFGPFGRVPRFYSSPFLVTDVQAAAAAAKLLNQQLGTSQSVSFGTVVLPHLEPGDVATITRQRAGIDEDHVIDALTIPLAADGSMTGRTRAKVVLA